MGEYPTDEELEKVKLWSWDDPQGLYWFLKSIWWADGPYADKVTDEFGFENYEISMHTWGWSGNEEIVSALQKYEPGHIPSFWIMYWASSRRGGHYTFEVPVDRWIPVSNSETEGR